MSWEEAKGLQDWLWEAGREKRKKLSHGDHRVWWKDVKHHPEQMDSSLNLELQVCVSIQLNRVNRNMTSSFPKCPWYVLCMELPLGCLYGCSLTALRHCMHTWTLGFEMMTPLNSTGLELCRIFLWFTLKQHLTHDFSNRCPCSIEYPLGLGPGSSLIFKAVLGL